ncbi:MAG: reverse transcriptase-like protein [Candidatus Acidiferrales bacterium]
MNKRPTPPKGAGLFGDHQPEHKPTAAFQANIDGGSRGNPGPAAYGVVVRDARGEVVARLKKYIGQNTNNVAEYYGLIAALDYAQSHGIRALRIASDSELLVKQMRGQYKVKSADLRPLFERARKMAQGLESFRIDHVYREQNREADALANQALDETSKPVAGTTKNAENASPKPATIRCFARYKDGVLQPQEPLDLLDGAQVEIMLRLRK